MLKIFLDSEGLEQYLEKKNLLDNLLLFEKGPFEFLRSKHEVKNEFISKIKETRTVFFNTKQEETLLKMYDDLNFHPRNPGQTQFLYLMLKYANPKSIYYVKECAFVS